MGAPRPQPSEFLPPDDVSDDERNREPDHDRGEEKEEPRGRSGSFGRPAAEVVHRIDARPLPRRSVLLDPEDQDDDQDRRKAPEPRQRQPVDMPGLYRMRRLLVSVQIVIEV